MAGDILPTVITVLLIKLFLITKKPPVAELLKKSTALQRIGCS